MIIRTWKARTSTELTPRYLEQVRAVVIPHLQSFSGYKGAQFTTRGTGDDVEVLVLTYWDSIEAVRAFAGAEETHAYMPPEIAETLTSYDGTSDHFEVLIDDRPS